MDVLVLTSSVQCSLWRKSGSPVRTGYCTAKAGILGLTLAMGTYLVNMALQLTQYAQVLPIPHNHATH